MEQEQQGIFSGVNDIENCKSIDSKVDTLQNQITSLKRDLEYTLYNLDISNMNKSLQSMIQQNEQQ